MSTKPNKVTTSDYIFSNGEKVTSGKLNTIVQTLATCFNAIVDYVSSVCVKATNSNDGLISKEDFSKLTGIEENANNYTLPSASTTVLGGVKVGTGLSADSSGVLSTEAQKNSDITKAEIEAKLTGTISSHSHSVTIPDIPSLSSTLTRLDNATATNASSIAQNGLTLTNHKNNKSNPHEVTKAQIGLGNVTDGAQKNSDITKAEIEAKLTGTISSHSHTISISEVTGLQGTLDGKLSTTSLGSANGVASLDENGNVPTSQLSSYQEILLGVTDIRAYLGMLDTEDILGITLDYKNKTCTRIAGAKNLTAGANFDEFNMYGGRKRCNVSDGGTINAYYGDAGYKEDGSNGQVMVYQPKFYYLVCPLEYDKQDTGYGYHLRKANYYVSETQRAGFKLHPAFYDKNGNEVDYILLSAYEGCIWDADGGESGTGAYILNDAQVMSASADKFCSIAGAKPATGVSQDLTRPNIEQMAKNRGEGWHSLGIKTASMEQLLMIVEMGMMNLQTAIGQGVVNLPWTTVSDSTSSYAGATGSTGSLGNGTGRATKTTTYEGGIATDYTVDGKTSICYRGVENFWGNIWEFVYGVNIWGNGAMAGGQPFICTDFNYAESKNNDNYVGAGFTVTKANGYISAMGYSTKYDWLFMASECLGNSSLPVGDYTYITENLNGYRIARLGGRWADGSSAGGFSWALSSGVGYRARDIGGRLVYVPTVTV